MDRLPSRGPHGDAMSRSYLASGTSVGRHVQRNGGAMIRRFVGGLKKRDSRRFFLTYLAGKRAGTVLVLGVIAGIGWYFGAHAGAQDAETPQVAVEALT